MLVKKSKKLGLSIIYPNTNFVDVRGRYVESFNKKNYKKLMNINLLKMIFQ